MKAAIYARVSTDRQDTANQLADLRSFCASRGWEIAAEYVDEDVSGKTERKRCWRLCSGTRTAARLMCSFSGPLIG